ncbi:MAG: T9SS type A sorting domain-containing protein [Tannerella sp.]|jgi:hypothetical protein|nr:T9SS type A sorting domain-containing protein [Tannerella sp.]
MKKIWLVYYAVSLSLLHITGVSAQISEGGTPPSFKYAQSQTLRSAVKKTEVQVDFYIEDLREVDNWRAREGAPMPVAKLIPVDYTMDNSGNRTALPGGERIWMLHLNAPNAVALMLYYQDFYIPEGGKLFIYSADKSQLLGAYTEKTHSSGGLFVNEFIGGDELILEYVESEISSEKPRIHIDNIGYGYNTSALETFCGITTRAVSGSCMVNINCEEGDAWQNEKKGICHMVQRIGKASYICTGSLVNNTAEDFRPLILTARHCASYCEKEGSKCIEVVADSLNMQQWVFYFHMEREGCSNSSLTAGHKTMTGCKLLVNTGKNGGSDGMLLHLNDMIPEEYDVFYNGWDINDTPASSGVGIHHPSGDYMKISTYETPAKKTTFMSEEFTGYENACWNVTFQQTANGRGVTEGGSSGSPQYNENKLIVGTLTGGNSTCNFLSGLNIYGKMSYHWDKFKKDSAHMDIWLDPLGTGVKILAGRSRKIFKPAPVNIKAVNQGQSILLTWEPPQSAEPRLHYNVYRNNQKIGEVLPVSFIDRNPTVGSLVYSVSAVYEDDEESTFSSTTISYVKFKAPADLKIERIGATNKVKLSWNAPVYEQTIYWGTMYPTYRVGFENNSPFYYGQKWSSEEIAPLNGEYIEAVQFFPWENNTYEIYISQGEYSYRQNIEPSLLIYKNMTTVTLNEPFPIDGSKSLIVSVYSAGGDYPAICDDGPAVDGKGNIYSPDGEHWEKFYDEGSPDEFNFNFIVSAVVSSERRATQNDNGNDKDFVLKRNAKVSEHLAAGIVKLRIDVLPFDENPVSLRSSMPAVFPEISQYRIYCNKSVHRTVDAAVTEQIEQVLTGSEYRFAVSAFYGNIESEKSEEKMIYVGVENVEDDVATVYPTVFSGFVTLRGHSSVTRVDVISVSGKVCLAVDNPVGTIDTSSLSPGLYFFRIYGSNNQILNIVRAIKVS